MTCREWQELSVEAYYGELSAELRHAFEEHLASCEECRSAYTAVRNTLSLMDQRRPPEPGEEFLSTFWERLRTSIERGEPAQSSSIPARKKLLVRPAFMPGWALGAAAALILAIGIYLGRVFFIPAVEQPVHQTPELARVDTTAEAVHDYLDRSRALLLGLVNSPSGQASPEILEKEQAVARRLLNEGTILKAGLKEPSHAQLKRLISDLEIVLMQLANYSVDNHVPLIELVRQGVDKKSILLKINLEELEHALSVPPGRAGNVRDSGKTKT